jgi:DNA-directed RNA polymerase sigma subunit (sigma70/sigma32)
MAQFPPVHLFQKELARLYATTGAKSCDELARQVVCNRMKISQERFESLRVAMSMSELHLEAPLFAGSDFTLADLTPGDFTTQEDKCVERDRKREVAIAMKSLSDREALVMRLVMREETMDQIGKKLGVTKQRVKQINDSAFRKMRASILSHRSGFHGAAQ